MKQQFNEQDLLNYWKNQECLSLGKYIPPLQGIGFEIKGIKIYKQKNRCKKCGKRYKYMRCLFKHQEHCQDFEISMDDLGSIQGKDVLLEAMNAKAICAKDI